MRKLMMLAAVAVAGMGWVLPASAAKPYTAAAEVADGAVPEVTQRVKAAVEEAGFEVAGSYHPLGKDRLAVVSVTDPAILDAIRQRPETEKGGLPIFGAALRVGIRRPEDKAAVEVSFTNPTYWTHAYFQSHYGEVKGAAEDAESRLLDALQGLGEARSETYGGEVAELDHYHYMMFMPYLEDHIRLAGHEDFTTALEAVRSGLADSASGVSQVYEVVMEDKGMAVFGVALEDPDKGAPTWFPKLIERHVAALPYEVAVVDGNVYMAHGRFRIALGWPELTMATFGDIMSAPGDTKTILEAVAGGS